MGKSEIVQKIRRVIILASTFCFYDGTINNRKFAHRQNRIYQCNIKLKFDTMLNYAEDSSVPTDVFLFQSLQSSFSFSTGLLVAIGKFVRKSLKWIYQLSTIGLMNHFTVIIGRFVFWIPRVTSQYQNGCVLWNSRTVWGLQWSNRALLWVDFQSYFTIQLVVFG